MIKNTFKDLKGKVITKITGASSGSENITFLLSDGAVVRLYHEQDCSGSVTVEDVVGDIQDLLGTEILLAEEVTSKENPIDVNKDYQDSFTWTFYKLATINGSVTIRWYGESNGNYSEVVDCSWGDDD